MLGRRREDTLVGDSPDDIRIGDYWKIMGEDGPIKSDDPQNLTGTCWHVVVPFGEKGYAIGQLVHHTVREHEDGTISVLPGDGSSNSILITGSKGRQWHGYINHGDFYEA